MKDRFGRTISYLRVSVTDRCNLRCGYCMPHGVEKLSHGQILRFEEITEIVAAAAALGVRKVRLTGGEPLVRRNIAALCAMVAAVPGVEELALTTNGQLLEPMAAELKAAGVRRLNISLDTLDPARYRSITGGGELEPVLRGIRAAAAAGLTPIKLNTVLLRGINEEEIQAFVELTRQQPLELRFIELMPTVGQRLGREAYCAGQTVLEQVPELEPLPYSGGPARLYRLPDGVGRVGLIAPMSHRFCGSCDRLRLTAEGHLKPCLHGGAEVPLRGLHGEALTAAILQAVELKQQRHQLQNGQPSAAGRPMQTIGG